MARKQYEEIEKKTTRTWFFIYLGIFALFVLAGYGLLFLLNVTWPLPFNNDTGVIGDTIGGFMGPLIAIAAAVLTFMAFWVQYKANIYQRQDISIERFENNFFEMLHLLQEIKSNLMFEIKENGEYVKYAGYDVFDCLYTRCELEKDGKSGEGVKGIYAKYSKVDADDIYLSDYFVRCLDHYFRMLYRIVKYVDDSEVIKKEKKYDYICIVRATLSWYELLILFYNGLSDNGREHFKPLIERYALLNNLRTEELAREEDRKLYSSKYNDDYPFELDENRDMTNEYKKGAFVYQGQRRTLESGTESND